MFNNGFYGVRFLNPDVKCDHRGALGVIEAVNIGFDIKRVFFIKDVPTGSARAEHAVSALQIIVLLDGSVEIDFDNGTQTMHCHLNSDMSAVRISPGVWIRLSNFKPGTILLVLSTLSYSDVEYYCTPNLRLLRNFLDENDSTE